MSLVSIALLPLLSTTGRAVEPCGVDLARAPRVVVANDFLPRPRECAAFDRRDCRVSWSTRPEAPTFADYILQCASGSAPPAPAPAPVAPPPAPADEKLDPKLMALKTGPWIDGAAVVIPEDSRCVTFATARSRLGRTYPDLSERRAEPSEKEPRLRVWSLSVDKDGYASVIGPGATARALGVRPDVLPTTICRSPVTIDGKLHYNSTQVIIATCPGAPQPQLQDGCARSSGDIIWSDLRRLTSGNRGDPGAAFLEDLAAADAQVAAMEAGADPDPEPAPAAPARPSPAAPRWGPECADQPRPVPLDQLIAIWPDGRGTIRRAAAANRADRCAVIPADLDPDGLVLGLMSRFWQSSTDRTILGELWRSDAVLGGALLEALDGAAGEPPALRAESLRDIVRAAIAGGDLRGFSPEDVEAFDDSREELLVRIDQRRADLSEVEATTRSAAEAFEAFESAISGWPSHARDRLGRLETQREQVSAALRTASLPAADRRAGNGVMLGLIQLVERIEADPVHELLADAEAVRADIKVATRGIAVECRRGLSDAAAAVPEAIDLEQAVADPKGFADRRQLLARIARDVEAMPCEDAVSFAQGLVTQVRNLDVVRRRISPDAPEHPTLAESKQVIRRTEVWLRSLQESGPSRLSAGVVAGPPGVGLSLGYHTTLWHRGPTVFGARLLPTWRPSPGGGGGHELTLPADLFLGLGPAWRSRTVVQPQLHLGLEAGVRTGEGPVGGLRTGGSVWLLPVRGSGHGVFADLTVALRTTPGEELSLSPGLLGTLGYHFQWPR